LHGSSEHPTRLLSSMSALITITRTIRACYLQVSGAIIGPSRPGPKNAVIVRGADTAHLDLAPQAAGLLAASLGLSHMHKDDLVQLEASFSLYDAFYRWARDAVSEEHNWPTPPAGARP
jgi:hypothetical protein